ncbi:MAG TPA: lysophospholipid acyltransferase family protein [Gemmatimonadales bacterium]|nr:lysophospholipid acyltransferase family protein [Gemmatimonadales bacterium]
MRLLRAWFRLAALTIWTTAGLVVYLAAVGITLGIARLRLPVRRRVFRSWARGVEWILGVRVDPLGVPPRAPFLLVANHLSYLDVVILAARLEAVFVAKQEVAKWPVIGLLASVMDTIFVDRNAPRDTIRVMGRLEAAVTAGDGVVLFAEATSSPGSDVLPFRPALLEWAARHEHPVYHASLSYRTRESSPPAHLAVCWWGDMTFGSHLVSLAALPTIHATVVFGEEPIQESDRRRLAEQLHQAVRERFVPVVTNLQEV